MKPLFLLALLASSPALAECPTGADLATGIRITETDGTTQTYRTLRNSVVQVEILYSDGYMYRNLLGKGTHVLQLTDVENGRVLPDSIMNTAYPVPAASLPVPIENGRWEVETTVNAYGDIYAETQTQSWGRMTEFAIGACTYDVIPGKVRYDSDGFVIDEGIYYFPELGIGLLHFIDDSEGDPESFTFRKIEAVR